MKGYLNMKYIGRDYVALALIMAKRQVLYENFITFEELSETKEYLNTKITNIYKYNNFKDLINDFSIELMADKTLTKDELLHTLNEIYTIEQQDKYGVLAIEIELI